ncbi:MATE efflux family protein [Turicibacter sanguinis]|nr:MATE efflux family protein [Turicibacter sanguinis]
MKREKQLVKNTIIVAIGKICTQFISFFLLPLYTALLSAEEYGTVDLLNTYVSLLIPIIFLQIDQAIFRHLIDVRDNEKEKKVLIGTTIYIVILQSIIFLTFFVLIGNFINNNYKYFLATTIVASMFSNVLLQISRGLGDNTTYSEGSLVSGVGTIVLNVLLIVVFNLGAYGMLTATLISNILCALFVFLKKKIYKYMNKKYFNKEELKKLWKYSVPLVPNQLSWWIINGSDRTIVTYILGVSINGIYSAANKFSSICICLFGIFNMTWAESASMYINDEDSSEYFSNIMNVSIKLFTSLCVGIIAFMPFVFKLFITGKEYEGAYYQIPILMLATIFNIIVSLLGSVYVALKKSGEIAKTSIYSAIINIIINVCLIKFIGLYAASISTLLSYLAMSIYRYLDVQKYVKIKLDKKFILISIPTVIIICIFYYLKIIIFCVLGALLSVIFALFYNISFIKEIFKTIKNKIKKDDNNNVKLMSRKF